MVEFIIISIIAIAVFSFIGVCLVVESAGRHQKIISSQKNLKKVLDKDMLEHISFKTD